MFVLGGVLAVVLSQAGCTTARTEWWPAERTPLRLSDGMPFAWVQSSTCLLAVGPSAQARFNADGGVTMSAEQYGVSLEGVLWEPQVFVAAPLEFGWGVVSSPMTPLQVRRVVGSEAQVVPAPRTDLVVAGAWTPRRVACASLRWDGWREGGGMAICCRGAPGRLDSCPQALHLYASNGTRTEPVGTLEAQVAFVPGEADGGWRPIELEQSFFGMSHGWALVVASEEFEACHPKVLRKPEGHLAAPTHLADE